MDALDATNNLDLPTKCLKHTTQKKMTSRKKAAKKARRAAKAANEARAKAIEDWRQENLDYTDEELEQLVDLDHWEAQLEQQVNDAKAKMREKHQLEVVADHMEA